MFLEFLQVLQDKSKRDAVVKHVARSLKGI